MNCSDTQTPEALHKYHLFANGNEAAFGWLVARFRPTLVRAAWYYVRDHYAVSAILQEVYLKAWVFRQRISSYCHLFRFMRLCIKWKCLSWLKSSRHAVYTNYIDSVILENHRIASCNPFEEDADPSIQKEKWQQITKAIECLPQRRQSLMQLRFYQGLSAAKIAKRMHMPVTHVREEIKESINWLKQAIHSPNGFMVTTTKPTQLVTTGDHAIDTVFTLRKHQKLSFAQIAQQLHLPQSIVLQHYLAANRLTTNSKNETYAPCHHTHA